MGSRRGSFDESQRGAEALVIIRTLLRECKTFGGEAMG